MYAHDWKILGDDHIQRWTNSLTETFQVKPQIEDKRHVRVDIFSWKDAACIGGKHVSLRIDEENNQWWCEKENTFVEISCDSDNRGASLTADCYTDLEAKTLAICFINLMFGTPRSKKRRMWRIDKF